jgi:putative oxygen-independent coproporphyrinogen III oxidase
MDLVHTLKLNANLMLPLSLYIHIPWCVRKCPYCDFNSHKSPDELPETRYVQTLLSDLDNDLAMHPPRPITSIFIGGGTPSLFSVDAFEQLFEGLRQRLTFANDLEITLEANPGTVDQNRFEGYRALGINRLSLGIQSFNATHLKKLGRIHDDRQAHTAILAARQAGFDNINIDLMHGLPNQTHEEGLLDLKTALTYAPEHLSWYQLTIEPNTVFYKRPPTLPSEDEASDLEEAGFALLAAEEYTRYEISAFSRAKKQAQHNLNYWLFGDYYGIGAGAHGKWTSPDSGLMYRTRKQRQPTDYLNPDKPFFAEVTSINEQDALLEFMLNATRLQQAIPYSLFTERTQVSRDRLMPGLLAAEKIGLVQTDATHWQVTPRGRRYTNDLQALFLP